MKRIFWLIAWFKSLFVKRAQPKPMSVRLSDDDLYVGHAGDLYRITRAQAKRERRKLQRLRNARLL